MPAQELAHVAQSHAESGGCSLYGLGVRPRQLRRAAGNVALMLARKLSNPDLSYIRAPTYDKHSERREPARLALRLPTRVIGDLLARHVDPDDPATYDR